MKNEKIIVCMFGGSCGGMGFCVGLSRYGSVHSANFVCVCDRESERVSVRVCVYVCVCTLGAVVPAAGEVLSITSQSPGQNNKSVTRGDENDAKCAGSVILTVLKWD